MADPKIKYDIEAAVKGDADVQELAQDMRRLGNLLEGDLKTGATQAAAALEALGAKQRALTAFGELKREVAALGGQLDQASAAVDRLGGELQQSEAQTRQTAAAEQAARAATEQARAALESKKAALQALRDETASSARRTEDYRSAVASLQTDITRAQSAVTTLAQAERDAARASSESGSAEAALRKEYDQAVASAGTLSKAVGAKAASLAQSRESMAALGLSTFDLAQQERELQSAMASAKAEALQIAQAHRQADAAAQHAADSQAELKKAQEAHTQAIRQGLQVAQSEIELQRQHLGAAAEEQQARLRAAKAAGDEAAALRASAALRQHEGAQLALAAQAKRAEATAVQQAADARRAELASIGPLTQAQTQELQLADNYARALRVQAAAADQAAARARDLSQSHTAAGASTAHLGERVQGLTSLLGQLGASMAGAFTLQGLVTAAAQMEQMRAGLQAVSGSAEKAGQDMDFVRRMASAAGLDVTDAARAFLSLSAATKGTAVEGEATRAVFEAVTVSMARAGKSSAETSNALLALGQMASKGTVQMEELRGQLGEALPGALNAVAAGLGITTKELTDLVEQGQITTQDLFPALAKGLNELYASAAGGQTLSAELANVKNAFVEMADRIGEAGALTSLKTGAELAQIAFLFLGEGLATLGQKIGAFAAALASMDFSQYAANLREIEATSRENLLKAAGHNDTLREALKKMGDASVNAALEQQKAGQAAQDAGQAAVKAGDDWLKLNNGYGQVLKSIRDGIELADKEIAAHKARGDAAIASAKLLGDEEAIRKAVGAAADSQAKALDALAAKRQQELDTLKAQLQSLREEAAAAGNLSQERQKQMEQLEHLIAKKQLEADATRAQADSARLHAHAMGEEAQKAAAARSAAEASRIEKVSEAQATVSLLETKKSLAAQGEQLARMMGDEEGARRFRIEQLKIDIELTRAKAEVMRAEAQGSIEVARASMQELEVKGELTKVKRAELEASIKIAEARMREADAIGQSTRVTQQAIDNLRDFGSEAGKAGASGEGAGERVAKGWDKATSSIGKATKAAQEYSSRGEKLGDGVTEIGSGGYQFRNRDGMTSNAQGQTQQQFIWTQGSIIDYLKSAGLEEGLARHLSKRYLQTDGTVAYEASGEQLRWAGKYGTLAEALGKMAEYYKYNDSGRAEAQNIRDYEAQNAAAIERERGRRPGQSASGGGTASGSAAGIGGVAGGQVVNLNYNGAPMGAVNTDATGREALQRFMGALQQGKSTSR